ncbi:RNA-binding (RRM/RBD/RNP motifs) family protein, partial [Striga asiatica]
NSHIPQKTPRVQIGESKTNILASLEPGRRPQLSWEDGSLLRGSLPKAAQYYTPRMTLCYVLHASSLSQVLTSESDASTADSESDAAPRLASSPTPKLTGLFDISDVPEFIGKEIVQCINMAKDGILAVLVVLSKYFGGKISDDMVWSSLAVMTWKKTMKLVLRSFLNAYLEVQFWIWCTGTANLIHSKGRALIPPISILISVCPKNQIAAASFEENTCPSTETSLLRFAFTQFAMSPTYLILYLCCRYLIVRNVPSLGCADELLKLFSTYGKVDECKPMDAEDCEAYTDVYWIKFHQVNNSRFAKRKLDESVFLGNRLKVSYAPEYESLSDTKEKLEGRRKEVVARLNSKRYKGGPSDYTPSVSTHLPKDAFPPSRSLVSRQSSELQAAASGHTSSDLSASSHKEYFPSESMNQTVHLVREKLNKVKIYNQVQITQKLVLPKGRASTIEEEFKLVIKNDHIEMQFSVPLSPRTRFPNTRPIQENDSGCLDLFCFLITFLCYGFVAIIPFYGKRIFPVIVVFASDI